MLGKFWKGATCGWPQRAVAQVVMLAVALLSLGGCTTIVNSVTEDFAAQLSNAILNNPDIETVRDGAPAYLILLDGLLGDEPSNVNLISQAATLNSAYASAFVTDPARGALLSEKALALSERAVCLGLKDGCDLRTRPFEEYEQWVAALDEDDVPLAYGLGTNWAGWLQAHSDDFAAIAELSRVKTLMQRMLDLAPAYDTGGPYLYMGVFETLLPPSMGGKPEIARKHFENALDIAGETALMVKVQYAEQYARGVFDRELHDKLLAEVLSADPNQKGLTLVNTIAQTRAKELMETADAYF